jgi:hypothetical protein
VIVTKKLEKITVGLINVTDVTKNADLSLGVSETVIKRVNDVTEKYGNIFYVVVGKSSESCLYKIIKGQEVIDALKKNKIKKVQAIIINLDSEIEQIEIALVLSTVNYSIGALAQGVMIRELVKSGKNLRQVSKIVGFSKSWLSKRQSLAEKMSDPVKKLLQEGALTPSTAEQVIMLPVKDQLPFATQVMNHSITKERVSNLVALYNDPSTPDILKRNIIENPLGVELTRPIKTRKSRKSKETGDHLDKLFSCAINIIGEVTNRLSKPASEDMMKYETHIIALEKSAKALVNVVNTVRLAISTME